MPNPINIRPLEHKDFFTIEKIAREAFWNLYIPGTDLHLLIHHILHNQEYITQLTRLIEYQGEIIGASFVLKAHIKEQNNAYEIISCGPFFIAPQYQRQGFGRKLMEDLITHAKKYPLYKAIALLGYYEHYAPYGFKRGKSFNLALQDGIYYLGLLVLPLYHHALNNIQGRVIFSPALERSFSQDEIEQFERKFPPKIKEFTPEQERYRLESYQIDMNEY